MLTSSSHRLRLLLAFLLSGGVWLASRRAHAPSADVADHDTPATAEAAPPPPDPVNATPPLRSRRFFVSIGILCVFCAAVGIAFLAASLPPGATISEPDGGIVVLTSIRGLAVDASTSLNTRAGVDQTSSAIDLSLRFRAATPAARAAVIGRTRDGLLFHKPFRYAIIFSGSAKLAFGDAATSVTGQPYPRIDCARCPDPRLELQLLRALPERARGPSTAAASKVPQLEDAFEVQPRALRLFSQTGSEGPDRPPRTFSPPAKGEAIGSAYGFRSGVLAIVSGTTTAGSGALQISGALDAPASEQIDGRERGALITLAAKFPRDVALAADMADGTYLTLPAPRSSSFNLEGTPGRLFAADVRANHLQLQKHLFDRMDFSSPVASLGKSSIRWQQMPANAPFTWQFVNDAEISDAAGRLIRNSLLAGLFLAFAASLVVLLIERAVEQWQPGHTLRTLRRGVAATLATGLTLACLLAAASDSVSTITAGGDTVAFSCPGPLKPYRPSSVDTRRFAIDWQADCEHERDSARRIAALFGFFALSLWLYVAWSARREPHRSLPRAIRAVLTVLTYGLGGQLLMAATLVWRAGLTSWPVLGLTLVANLASALVGIRHLRRLYARRGYAGLNEQRTAVAISVLVGGFLLLHMPGGAWAAGTTMLVGVTHMCRLDRQLRLQQDASSTIPGS